MTIRLMQIYGEIHPTETAMALGLAACEELQLSAMCSFQSGEHRRLADAGIPVHEVDFHSKLDVRAIAKVRRTLQRQSYDVVHGFTSRAIAGSLLSTSWMKQPPAIVAYRGIMDRIQRHDPVSWLTYLHPRLAGVTCISDSCRDALRSSGVSRALLRTIHLGHCPSPSRPCVYSEFGVPDDAFVVAFVGNIRPVKGIDVLLEAARRLGDLKDLHFLLFGEVRDPRVAVAAKNETLQGRVHLAGYKVDAERLLSRASLFVMPSRKEGLCKAVMEAMASGVCPVVTSVGGLPELVRHEKDGLVVPPEQPLELASAIRRLYHDDALRRRLAASAQRRILADFSVEKRIDRMRQFYKDIVAIGAQNAPRAVA